MEQNSLRPSECVVGTRQLWQSGGHTTWYRTRPGTFLFQPKPHRRGDKWNIAPTTGSLRHVRPKYIMAIPHDTKSYTRAAQKTASKVENVL